MHSNYLSAVLCSLLALPLVACGGDDNGGGMVNVPDAKVFMDAAPDAASLCSLETSAITEVPTDQNAAVIDFPASGQNPAYLSFRLVYGPMNKEEWLEFDHDKPVALNTDLNLANGCTAQSPFCMVLLGNITIVNNMLSQEQIFLARSGTIRITQADNAGGRFQATVTNAMFKRFVMGQGGLMDAMDTTCMASIANMTINLPVTAPMFQGADKELPARTVSSRTLRIAE